jgi:hypothetical protein
MRWHQLTLPSINPPWAVISLFEAFQSVLAGLTTGVAAGGRGTVAGLIFSAIGLYRVLYCEFLGPFPNA